MSSPEKKLTLQEYIECYKIKKELHDRQKRSKTKSAHNLNLISKNSSETPMFIQPQPSKSQTHLLSPTASSPKYSRNKHKNSYHGNRNPEEKAEVLNKSIEIQMDFRVEDVANILYEEINETKLLCREYIEEDKDFIGVSRKLDGLMTIFHDSLNRISHENMIMFEMSKNSAKKSQGINGEIHESSTFGKENRNQMTFNSKFVKNDYKDKETSLQRYASSSKKSNFNERKTIKEKMKEIEKNKMFVENIMKNVSSSSEDEEGNDNSQNKEEKLQNKRKTSFIESIKKSCEVKRLQNRLEEVEKEKLRENEIRRESKDKGKGPEEGHLKVKELELELESNVKKNKPNQKNKEEDNNSISGFMSTSAAITVDNSFKRHLVGGKQPKNPSYEPSSETKLLEQSKSEKHILSNKLLLNNKEQGQFSPPIRLKVSPPSIQHEEPNKMSNIISSKRATNEKGEYQQNDIAKEIMKEESNREEFQGKNAEFRGGRVHRRKLGEERQAIVGKLRENMSNHNNKGKRMDAHSSNSRNVRGDVYKTT